MSILVALGNDKLAKKRLAQLIKDLRGCSTQREFARLLGTSYTAIQDWEKQLRLPREENLERIAQVRGWTQEELLRYLFSPDTQPPTEQDPLEKIMTQVQDLNQSQLLELRDYLQAQLKKVENAQEIREKGVRCFLNDQQKHNLHLLLKASLKYQSPFEAMRRVGIDPALFTDIFLRNEKRRVVTYKDLEQLSCLCYRVIEWQADRSPLISVDQTYQGETALLFNDLNEGDQVRVDSD